MRDRYYINNGDGLQFSEWWDMYLADRLNALMIANNLNLGPAINLTAFVFIVI
jgi:hypothetical protein